MNTANLQLEGLYGALSALLLTLRRKGLLDQGEVEEALAAAEEAVLVDAGRPSELSPANVEAIRFPIRYLRAANGAAEPRSFSEITTAIGQAKPPR